ncbi:IS200/IS605 family transposase [Candidatus Woesebacteria bacterium]|nr:IS200/IS605 family transposase [Candidatus Woesebacteria bacterium]
MSKKYKSGSHTKHRLLFHIVFRPKYRKRVLRFGLKTRLQKLFTQCCQVNEWKLHELEIMPDHVHLLLQINPRDSLSSAIQKLRGGSSRVIRDEFPELEEFLWGDAFWGIGYFAESVGKTSEKAIRNYINQQNKQQERDCGL